MTLKHLFLAVPAFLISTLSTAQDVPFTCSTHGLEHLAPFLQGHPERLQEIQNAEQQLEDFTGDFARAIDNRGGGNTYVIPVVFHIIHNNGVENISDDQVKDAMRVLNDDFNKLNEDWDQVKEEFLPIVADIGVTFRLAGLDPDGNCTSGITRTVSDLTNDGGQDMKNLIQWPRSMYLNVWVCAYAQGAAGYTQTPGNVDNNWGAAADGIVLLHNYTGSIGTSSPGRSRTLTHEVGHWINLRHCWGPTNNPGLPDNCDSDDNVSDTPNTQGWTSCNRNGATCGSPLDNVENYMEYSYCSKMFTNGQRTRMLAALNSSTAERNNLWSASNLIATGTSDPQALCSAAFNSDVQVICSGGQVQFSDQSYHGPTSWHWSFPGGTPSTSEEQNPLVTYDTPGSYAVELTVSNASGTLTTATLNYITVFASSGTPAPYAEGFEGMSTLDPAQWVVVNTGDDAFKFELSGNAGYNSSKSVRMKNFNNPPGIIDELMGPTIDLSQETSVVLTFRYAFARRSSGNDDILRLYTSNNCGTTWSLRKQLRASNDLVTVPDQGSPFTPNGPEQWQQAVITNISSSFLVPDFRFKFYFQGDEGNDLWIDDINIGSTTVGVEELVPVNGATLNVVPNPATNDAVANVVLARAGRTRVELLDPTGRVVAVLNDSRLPAGSTRLNIPASTLTQGLYLLRVQQEEVVRVVRFTKN